MWENPYDPGAAPNLPVQYPHGAAMQATFITLAAITWYNAIELIILIFITFRAYRGLYFWSIFISASIGLIPYSVGFLLNVFKLSNPWLYCTILTVGWYCMVTGQAVVLYSRLHLVLRNRFIILRRVIEMICVNVVLLHLPTTILTYGANVVKKEDNPHLYKQFKDGYQLMEKFQMSGFCVQEFIISGLYIWETSKLIRLDRDKIKTKIMYQLVSINLVIICMDLGLLLIEYINFYTFETMIKGVVYGIKLKLEFAVLGKLIHLVSWQNYRDDSVIIHLPPPRHRQDTTPSNAPDFVNSDLTRTETVVTAPDSLATRRRTIPGRDMDEIDIAMFEHANLNPSREYNRYENDLESQSDQKSNAYSHDEYYSHSPPTRKSPSTSETKTASNKTWEGGDQTTIANANSTTTTNPVDFTDYLERQRASGCLSRYGNIHKPE